MQSAAKQILNQSKRFVRTRLNSTVRSILPKRLTDSNQTFPRDLTLRVHLTMLSWFLKQELPQRFSDLFDSSVEIEPLTTQGWSNFVFRAQGRRQEFVIRMRPNELSNSKDAYWAPYHKEAWICAALPATVPTATIHASGIGYVATTDQVKEYAYCVQSFIDHHNADQIRGLINGTEFRNRLGDICKKINSVETKGFGTKFDPETNSFNFRNWSDFLASEINLINFPRLIHNNVISKREASLLERRIRTLETLKFTPTLYHGDFVENWSNVLVNAQCNIKAIIDWELAGSGPALQMEIAFLLYMMIRDGRPKSAIRDDFFAFLLGYQLSIDQYYSDYAYDVETIILLQALKKSGRYLDLQARGELAEHRWRQEFFNRCKETIQLGAKLSEYKDKRILFTF
jgi:aminoglycoside phosphotransferase (APT) family kinase protein